MGRRGGLHVVHVVKKRGSRRMDEMQKFLRADQQGFLY